MGNPFCNQIQIETKKLYAFDPAFTYRFSSFQSFSVWSA
jgi:hypothetical protein